MTSPHQHTEFMEAREVRTLVDAMREHLDGRFDLMDLAQQQTAHTLNEVVRQQRETNGQVAKIQLWRAKIEGQFDGVRVAAGGARTLWLVLTAAISMALTIAGGVWTLVQAFVN